MIQEKISIHKLRNVPETLLAPLWFRAVETKRPDAIITDEYATVIVKAIDYDFLRFEKAKLSQLGVAIRTKLLDEATMRFIKEHPDAVVINIGAGLDTRFERVDNGKITWYDLDLPETIEIRKRFFQETDRCKFIAKSILDFSWIDEINTHGKPVLFVAEGVLMYFPEQELRPFFAQLSSHFPNSEMLFEMLSYRIVGKAKHHDTIKKIDSRHVEFQWGLKNTKEMESWNHNIHLIEEWKLSDYHKNRWGLANIMAKLPYFKGFMQQRIVHLIFQ